MDPHRSLRVAAGISGTLALLGPCTLGHTSTRGIVVLLSGAALASLLSTLAAANDRALVLTLVLECGATAVAFYGSVSTTAIAGAGIAGVLSLLSAELARWSAALPPGSEARGRPALAALLLATALGAGGAAGGAGLVAARNSFAGLGLAALGLGVVAAVGIMALVATLVASLRERSG